MRTAWRSTILILLLGIWPQLGCHQLPAGKSVQDLRPIQQKGGAVAKQELTAADVGQTLAAQAKALEDTQKLGEAVAVYEKMRATDPTQGWFATKKLALLYLHYNEFDKAEREFQLLRQNNPKDADTLCNLGDISYRRGHLGTAEIWYRDALSKQPEHAQALSGLGMTLALRGDDGGSVAAFKKMGLTDAEVFCQVASLLKGQKKNDAAMRYYQAALTRDPENARARGEMAQLYQDDPGLVARMMTPTTTTTAKRGTVELEPAPTATGGDPTGRVLIQRPSLPPLGDLDLGEDHGRDWNAGGKKK